MEQHPTPLNQTPTPPPKKSSNLAKTVWMVIGLIILCAILPQIIFPLLGIAFVFTAAAIGIAIVTIAIFAIALILFFIFPGSLILTVSIFALIWVILAIALFPILFPLIMPIFIILLFVAYLKRRNKGLK